ncbi:dUTP diphosphatase [Terribacillus sp. JSM ZJ617]|uniref:dUTP diphosphatase n=1 Tax=Terribacillus sp. JSM ZJ617 TaxID=3342119 RepID=UPI0035A8502A
MDLKALFETQAKLDADILVKHPVQDGEDRLSKKILALQVELGECANEWRGFKFWSNRQSPTKDMYSSCSDKEAHYFLCGMCKKKITPDKAKEFDFQCDYDGNYLTGMKPKNPLLEEYVDCLHFILSIGLDIGLDDISDGVKDIDFGLTTIVDLFSECYTGISEFNASVIWNGDILADKSTHYWFDYTFKAFLLLGITFGFTWEQVETAYFEKNKINLKRQESGY